jgi:uncharacterized protein YbjT (DUF2867 family)
MGPNIGVFPASGGLGTSIVNHLSKLVPASELVLIARKPENLENWKQDGATVRRADYDEPSTLDTAFDGVDVLILISYASFEIEHRVKVSENPQAQQTIISPRPRPTVLPSTQPQTVESSTYSTPPSASAADSATKASRTLWARTSKQRNTSLHKKTK